MRRFLLFLLLLTAILLAVTGYNGWLQTEEIHVVSSGLPPAFDGFRVLLVSDLHGRVFGEGNEALLDAAAAAQPDLIALCGDLLDDKAQIERTADLAEALCAIAPCYYVTGNHEWAAGCVNELSTALTKAGVTVLDDSYVPLQEGEDTIILAGFCDPNGFTSREEQKNLLQTIRVQYADAYILLLNHRNELPETFAELGVQTVLSGHGHGGVIRLPFIGGLLDTDRTLFPQYTSGLYTAGETNLVVSRGLGGTRILCRPHLPVVIFSREK